MPTLKNETKLRVRFNEVDALRIVWHGHYVNYFEDGRQAFGREFSLGYLDIFNEGFTVPIVDINVEYKSPLTFGHEAIIETTFIDSPAAKIHFAYEIFNIEKTKLVAKGATTQVFLSNDTGLLELYPPQFYLDWKKNKGIN